MLTQVILTRTLTLYYVPPNIVVLTQFPASVQYSFTALDIAKIKVGAT